MKVLIACEFSGIVRDAFAARGHDYCEEGLYRQAYEDDDDILEPCLHAVPMAVQGIQIYQW